MVSWLRRILLLGLPFLAVAQEPDQPVFRVGTRLVQVDVVVRTQAGPVRGLSREDFEVFDNGRLQQIAVFSVRETPSDGPHLTPLPAGAVTNRPFPAAADPVSATVILIDRQNTNPEDQGYAREQALKYLSQAGRRELIALYSLGTALRVLQPFTADREALRAAVSKSKMEQSFNLLEGQNGLLAGLSGNAVAATIANANQRRADITTAAFTTIARQLEGLPGRKKLIWITAALPLTFTQEVTRNDVVLQEFNNLSPQLFAATRIMNDANVALYPIDPRGVMFAGEGLSDPGITAMIRLAEMTGGKAFYNNNDLTAGLDAATTDTDVTYTLGYYPTEQEIDGSFHAITVRVHRPGVEVRYRKGYSAEQPRPSLTEKQRKGTLNAWVQEPLDATSIQIRASARRVANRPGYYAVEVTVDPAGLALAETNGRFLGEFDLAVVPFVERKFKGLHQHIKVNLTGDRLIEARSTGIVVLNAVKVTDNKGKPLSDELKVVVMDRSTGKAGSVLIPLGIK
jgi:VWFA-related protein